MYSMSAFLNRRDQSRFGDQKSFFTEPKKIRKLQVKVSRFRVMKINEIILYLA